MVKEDALMCVCENCGIEFIPKDKRNNHYCSRSCFVTRNNELRGKEHLCLYCNKKFKSKNSAQKFCSIEHSWSYNKNNSIAKWIKEEWSGNTEKSKELSKIVRDYLLEEANHVCSRCGFSAVNPFSGKTILQIHHKDGDYQNNSKSNLEVLCPNCHAMTETNGSLNTKGKGRRIRQRMTT